MDIKAFMALPHRFRWGGEGGDDCMTFPATWVLHVLGIDPAEGLRGTYRTRSEAHAIMENAGGPLAFMGGKLLPLGCKRVQVPGDGDIGLVRMLAGEDAASIAMTDVGAIRFGPAWAAISPIGVVAQRAEPVAIWRLPR